MPDGRDIEIYRKWTESRKRIVYHVALANAFHHVWSGIHDRPNTSGISGISGMSGMSLSTIDVAVAAVRGVYVVGSDPRRFMRAFVAYKHDVNSLDMLMSDIVRATEQEKDWGTWFVVNDSVIVVIVCPCPTDLATILLQTQAAWVNQLSDSKKKEYDKLAKEGLEPWTEEERIVFDVTES